MLHFDSKSLTENATLALKPNHDTATTRVMPRRPKSMTMREAVAVAHGTLQPLGEDMKNIFADIFDTPRPGERTHSASDLRAMLARQRLIKRPAAKSAATAAPPEAATDQASDPRAANAEPVTAPQPAAFSHDTLSDLRQSIDAPQDEVAETRPSLPMFLAIHTMNLVLLVVFAPLGLALTLFSLIKGPDLRLTANSLVMAGLLLSFGEITSLAMI